MSQDIAGMTARLAAEPDSLVFLPLGEALRQRGQLDAALAIAARGVERYPDLADAHDLLGRIMSDRGTGDAAFDAWTEALRLDPRHLGALRGLAFLAYRAGDHPRAERHLAAAVALAPDDAALQRALARVRTEVVATRASAPPPRWDEAGGAVLVDAQGRRLAGRLDDAADRSDAVAAELAGVGREAERAARLLGLGAWRSVGVECREAQWHLVPPTPETVLLAVGSPATPAGRLALVTERSAASARRWLERLA